MPMSQPSLILLSKSVVPLPSIPLLVLPMQIYDLRNTQNHRANQGSERHRMAQNIIWCITLEIDERADEGRAVCNGDDDTDCDCTNIVWRGIVGDPCLMIFSKRGA